MNPLVTVLLPVYNGEKYLHDAIQSIQSQRFKDYEFLIIDDGSTDGSLNIINSFKDPRIKVLSNNERLKLSGVLNFGIREAKGEYIARMDADDIALPERLELQVDFLESHPDTGLCGTWVEKFGQGKTVVSRYQCSNEHIKAYSLFDCPFAHPTVMFRREPFLNYNLLYDGRYYPTEDYELWSRAIDYFHCANLPRVLLRYRVHAASMTGSDWQEMDNQAASVARVQLIKLGFNVSAEELQFHRNIGRGNSFRVGSLSELKKGERWLVHLQEKNFEVGRYNEDAFLEILSLIWFRLCMHNIWLGFEVLRYFSRSLLFHSSKIKVQSMAILAASIVKGKVIKPTKQ